ncbi:aggregation-promoting factor C-terminal-like domain-containing protein [Apilactobacillus timberlakei]|uniref:aggregation-promoting factor C-terminal-like domain-containing protein n=1 Tax=Apilactobacillus timberlakei TaxID=2008380 RepID=UPI0011268118|nr:tape measure protein [Apilactobacillus timberlakei]TPR16641.1 hypothetical protein DYZ95_07305 [Apilactobacillus timberlakei]
MVNVIRHSTIGLSVAGNIGLLERADKLLDKMPDKASKAKKSFQDIKFSTTASKNVDKLNSSLNKLDSFSSKASKNIITNQDNIVKSSQKMSSEAGKSVNSLRDNLKDLSKEKFIIRPHVDIPNGEFNRLHQRAEEANRKMPKLHIFRDVSLGTMTGNLLTNAIGGVTQKLKEGAKAGFEYDKSQQKMTATWTTLTGNADKSKDMVNTINDLSVKTGQANDTVDELEQGFYHLHSNKKEADDLSKSMLNMSDAVGLSTPKIQAVTQDMVNGLSRGKANNGMLNQISQYFPMFREQLAKYETQIHHGKEVTVADLNEISKKGQISSQDIENVFNQLGSGKYNKAADNMLQTMYGMQRTIHARVPALIGEFENPIMTAKNPFYGAISKWVSDKHTEHEFKLMGQATTKGIDTITSAFGKAYNVQNGTKALDDATTHITHGITNLSNGIAKNAPQIKDFFSMTKNTGVLSFKLFAGVLKDVSAISLPLLNFMVKHEKVIVPMIAGMFVTNKVLGFGRALTPVIGSLAWIRHQYNKPMPTAMTTSMVNQSKQMQKASKGEVLSNLLANKSDNQANSTAFQFANKSLGKNVPKSSLGSLAAKSHSNGMFKDADELAVAGKYGSRLGRFSKFAKIGGASVAGLSIASSLTGLIGINNKNKYSKIGGTAGSITGTIAGGLIGSLAGPAGTAIGAGIGSTASEWVGKHIGNMMQSSIEKNSRSSSRGSAQQKFFSKTTGSMNDTIGQIHANDSIYSSIGKSGELNKSVRSKILSDNNQLTKKLKSQTDEYFKYNQSKSKQDAKIISQFHLGKGFNYKSLLQKDKDFYKNRTKNANSAINALIKAESKGGKGRESAIRKADKRVAKAMSKNADSQKIILGKMSLNSKHISDKQASNLIKQSYRAYKGTIGYANKTYQSTKKSANKKYKSTMNAANREYFVTHSIGKKQYEKITSQAEKTKNDTIMNARKQKDGVDSQAKKQHDKVVKMAKKQTKDHLASVDDETGGMLNQWQQTGKWLENTWSGITSWWSKNVGQKFKWIGETADKLTGMNENRLNHSGHVNKSTGKREMSAAEFRKAEGKSLGGYAKGTTGALKRSQTALVNEFGQESAWNPSKGTFRFLGNGKPMLAKLHAGEHIFTAKQTRALTHGGMHGNFKAYAGGTGAGNAIDAKITNPNGLTRFSKKAKSVWNDLKNHTKSSTHKISVNTQNDFDNMKSKSLDKLSSMHTGATKNVKSLVSDFNSIIGKLTGYTDDAMKGVTDKLNKGFTSINSSLSQFGGNKSVLKPIHYANGSNGKVPNNHLAVVNDALSGPRQEAVVRNNKLLYPNGKNALVALQQGDQVLNGRQTQMIESMNSLAHYAKGSGVSDDKLRDIANANSKNPSSAWSQDFAKQINNNNGSTLNKGMTNTAGDGAKSVGIPWSKAMWGLISNLASGGSGSKSAFLNYAMKNYSGKKYVLGADGPSAYDCSGMVSSALAHFGINIGRTTTAMQSSAGLERIGRNIHKTQAGDIALFGHGNGASGHVGIVNNPGQGTIFNETPPYARTTPLSYITALPLDAFYRVKGLKNKVKSGGNKMLDSLVKKQLGKRAMNWIGSKLAPKFDIGGGPAPTGDHSHWLKQAGIPNSWWPATNEIINDESSWNPRARNASGAYGLPQALPGNKMASAGSDWESNPITQLRWFKSYVGKYGGIKQALAFRHAHGWYANGGWADKASVFGEVPGQPEVAINPQRKSADNLIMSAMHARDKFTGGSFSKRMARMLKLKNGKNERHNLMQKALSSIKSAPNNQSANSNKVEVHIGKIVVQGGNGNIPQNIGAMIAKEVQKALANRDRKTMSEVYGD